MSTGSRRAAYDRVVQMTEQEVVDAASDEALAQALNEHSERWKFQIDREKTNAELLVHFDNSGIDTTKRFLTDQDLNYDWAKQ